MTHDELLATIEKSELGWYYDWMKDALRAVVELHGQVGVVCGWCTCYDCDHIAMYPCKTVQTIQGAFNADL